MDCFHYENIAVVVLLTVGTLGQNKHKIHQEDAFCTNFTAGLTVRDREGFTITVTLGQSFWEAVRYFRVRQVSFEPFLERNGKGWQLGSLRCRQNASFCENSYEFSDVTVTPEINYDLNVDISCLPPPFTSYPCDGDCEAFSTGVSFRGMEATPDPLESKETKTNDGANRHLEPWIFIVLGTIVVCVLLTVVFFIKNKYKRISLSQTFTSLFSNAPDSNVDSGAHVIEKLEILVIASSAGISEEIRTFLTLLREKESILVTFHEEQICEVVKNENDWIDRQFRRVDFVLLVLSDDILEHSEFPGLEGKLLRRLESEASMGRVKYAAACFEKSGDIKVLNILNRMKTVHRLLDFPSIFYFPGILQNSSDNRLDYHLSSLVNMMRNIKANTVELHDEKREESNVLLPV